MFNASNSLEDTTMTSLNNSKAPCSFNDLSLRSQLSYSKNYVPKETFFGTAKMLNQDDNYDKSSSIFSYYEDSISFYEQNERKANTKNHSEINFIFNLNNHDTTNEPIQNEDTDDIVVTSYYKSKSGHDTQSTSASSVSRIDNDSIFMMCKTQSGCRNIQNKIIIDAHFANYTLYPGLRPKMLLLINDQFGNYLYQQFMDVLNETNLKDLICFISLHFSQISYSPHGTRVIQKLIEEFSQNPREAMMIYEMLKTNLAGRIYEMSNDENANHIIQKFILLIKYPYNDFVYAEIYNTFTKIAVTKYGCCVVQKCLMNGIPSQKEKIVFLILQNTFYLISNQFGNYVYQCLIFLNDDRIIIEIYKIIYHQLIALCKEKYSSNVIEKIFDIKNKMIIKDIARHICESEENIMELVTDQYGNYIIQKIINTVMDHSIIMKIINVIASNVQGIYKISFGKKLIIKLSKRYKNLEKLLWV